jgi:hypothetical protein
VNRRAARCAGIFILRRKPDVFIFPRVRVTPELEALDESLLIAVRDEETGSRHPGHAPFIMELKETGHTPQVMQPGESVRKIGGSSPMARSCIQGE